MTVRDHVTAMSKLHTDRSEGGVELGTFICADDQLAVWQLLFYDLWKYKDVGDGPMIS